MKLYHLLSTALLLASQASAAYENDTYYARCRCTDAQGNPTVTITQAVCPVFRFLAALDRPGEVCVVTGIDGIKGEAFATRHGVTKRDQSLLMCAPSKYKDPATAAQSGLETLYCWDKTSNRKR
ncbi:hypothetical protein EJ03DRAFT_334332 [Teratosphaeria nubilosa]|uniref:Secreted protein n=1 Tax=Teratosphaeria nubilosa TaxID=161662 RepID=A0A6G1LHS5_9PEZI|nr:hypothetical protein EJ03DRAFT_334332 [Teratosphaeria nubilosa]